MIVRIWRGWTTPANADRYESLLQSEIFPGIAALQVPGYREIQLLRRDSGKEVEFTTVMWFDSLKDVREFAGEDYQTAYVPAKARRVLKRFDAESIHHELRERMEVR